MLVNFQTFCRVDASSLPPRFHGNFPISLHFGGNATVYFEIERVHEDVDVDVVKETLLAVTTISKEIPNTVFELLRDWSSLVELRSKPSVTGLENFGSEIIDLARSLQFELDGIGTKAAHLIGWKHRVFGFPHKFESSTIHLMWGLPDEKLDIPPFLNRPFPRGVTWLPTPDIWDGKFSLDGMSRIDPPLYFELLNDAVSAIEASPKSSLVMFVAALETAIKQYCIAAAPDTEWLISEIASPPITRLYSHYLKLLPAINGKLDRCLPLPKALIKKVELYVSHRNSIVHGKHIEIHKDSLMDTKVTVTQILYYIDWLRGEEWAFEYMSNELKLLINPS